MTERAKYWSGLVAAWAGSGLSQAVSFRQACMNRREAFGIVGCRREAAWRTADENRSDAESSRMAGATPPAVRAVA